MLLRTRRLDLSATPVVMGIVNVTPDSFSDGGAFLDPQRAIQHGRQLVAAGAQILDIGGESTRPYAESIDAAEEWRRIEPVVRTLSQQVIVPLSVDTSKAFVARAALEAGAEMINDVTGLSGDPEMIEVARTYQAGLCAMHMQGTPQTMQDAPAYDDVVQEVFDYLAARRDALVQAGINPERICLDPGIGFGKTHAHNLELIRQAGRFQELGVPLLFGPSRKGFIAHVLGDKQCDRMPSTVGVACALARAGVHILRVHDVAAVCQALKLFVACGGTR
jgi:dihydropteroate synthase